MEKYKLFLTDALRDAALLARAIIRDDLARYETERDEHAVPMLEVTDAIASFAWTLDELMELHRRLQSVIAGELDLVRELVAPRRWPTYGRPAAEFTNT